LLEKGSENYRTRCPVSRIFVSHDVGVRIKRRGEGKKERYGKNTSLKGIETKMGKKVFKDQKRSARDVYGGRTFLRTAKKGGGKAAGAKKVDQVAFPQDGGNCTGIKGSPG